MSTLPETKVLIPAMALRRVVLPVPEGPISADNVLGGKLHEIPFKTVRPPLRIETLSTTMDTFLRSLRLDRLALEQLVHQ